eukprot:13442358-Ditylum_brightwellii.AAC.1
MKSLNSNVGKRHKYMFLWCCNKQEIPPDMDKWYEQIDKYSFCPRNTKQAKGDYDDLSDDNDTPEETEKLKKQFLVGELSRNPWESKEYKALYGMNQNENVLDVTTNDMLEILEGFETESDTEYLSVYAQARLQIKCTYLTTALESALEFVYKEEKRTGVNVVRFDSNCQMQKYNGP